MELTQSRVCVALASEWAGKQEWSHKRRRCQKSMDKIDFVTFTMMSVKHSAAHRTMLGERVKPNEERINQENWVRLIHQFTHTHRRHWGANVEIAM